MFEIYQSSFIGIWVILTTIMIQAMVAIRFHRGQRGGYKPGIIKPELNQSSIVFRSYRTFQNSLEIIVPILGITFLEMFAGYSSFKLAIIIWIYAIARIGHMILYYKISTERNPSPRSLPWAIGFLAGIYFMVDLGIFLI